MMMPAETTRSRPASPSTGQQRVMVISSRREIAESLRRGLPRGFRVETSEEVWRSTPGAPAGRVDAILIDLAPPIADLFVTLRAVRSEHPDVPIVTLVDEPLRPAGELSLHAGAAAYLLMPPNLRRLSELIRSLGERRSPGGPRSWNGR